MTLEVQRPSIGSWESCPEHLGEAPGEIGREGTRFRGRRGGVRRPWSGLCQLLRKVDYVVPGSKVRGHFSTVGIGAGVSLSDKELLGRCWA